MTFVLIESLKCYANWINIGVMIFLVLFLWLYTHRENWVKQLVLITSWRCVNSLLMFCPFVFVMTVHHELPTHFWSFGSIRNKNLLNMLNCSVGLLCFLNPLFDLPILPCHCNLSIWYLLGYL